MRLPILLSLLLCYSCNSNKTTNPTSTVEPSDMIVCSIKIIDYKPFAVCGKNLIPLDSNAVTSNSCTVIQGINQLTLNCPDGSSATIYNGTDGLSTRTIPVRSDYISDCEGSGLNILTISGYDSNKNNKLELEFDDIVTQEVSYICDGNNGKDSKSSVIETIDPCGDKIGVYDELLLRLDNGDIIAYFEDGGQRFLTNIIDGQYRTTDKQNCNFKVLNGEVIW